MDDDIQINTVSAAIKSFKKVEKHVLKRKNVDDDDNGVDLRKPKKFKSTTNDQENKTSGKFSSLFKNNANIPVIKKYDCKRERERIRSNEINLIYII
jgi:hypothetical protein